MIARGDALIELAKFVEFEVMSEFGLADEDDLNEFLGFRLEVR